MGTFCTLSPHVLPLQVCQGAKVLNPCDPFLCCISRAHFSNPGKGRILQACAAPLGGRVRLLPHGGWLQQLSPNPARHEDDWAGFEVGCMRCWYLITDRHSTTAEVALCLPAPTCQLPLLTSETGVLAAAAQSHETSLCWHSTSPLLPTKMSTVRSLTSGTG